jgi:hypothetical protein
MQERDDALDVCCERLVRNDPTLIDVTVPIFRSEYLEKFSLYLPKSTSVIDLSFDIFVNDRTGYNLDPMLKYLSETKLIRSVMLNSSSRYHPPVPLADEAGRLIRAIAGNADIELVQFSVKNVPLHARNHGLLDLLHSKAVSLRHLTLQGMCCQTIALWPELDVAAFAEAVGGLSRLQSLTLEPLPNPELVALTLYQLGAHKHLQKLSIHGYFSEWTWFDTEIPDDVAIVNAVSAILQSRLPLEILELRSLFFSRAGMENLLLGLERCSTLVELAVEGSMSGETEEALVCFLRAGKKTAVNGIRRLCLRNLRGTSSLFPSILKPDDGDPEPGAKSIGESLQALNLPYLFDNIDVLLNVLADGAHHLSSLSFGLLTATSWLQLTRGLPNLVHLKELHFNLSRHRQNDVSSVDFVRAMQRNGSLCRISEICFLSNATFPTPVFSATELRKLRIYGQRNQEAQELLQIPFLPSDDTSASRADALLSLFPMLFHVMKPAQRLAPNCVLVGLLACSSVLGPDHSHVKRLDPSNRSIGLARVVKVLDAVETA